jgi:hypothetical protein
MPHADGVPDSLWWYAHNRADARAVIDAYLMRYARGAKVSEGFRDELTTWLGDLTRKQNLAPWGKPRTKRFWTIPNYARAHKLQPFTLMKRLRELEKIAKEMYPDRAAGRGRVRANLTPAEISDIRLKYREGVNVEDIAQEFRISEGHVGQLCREERKRKLVERETRPEPPSVIPDEDLF